MSHFYIAQNILNTVPLDIGNISQYYLGSVAPDAIHFRKNYERNQKRISHLYINLEKGNIECFTEKWKTNVINYFYENNSQDNHDFLLGYCIHIMVDIYYYQNIWKPFVMEYTGKPDIDFQKIYTDENLKIDFEIFMENNYQDKLFPILIEANTFDFGTTILKTDLDGIKVNITNRQYKCEPIISITENEFMDYEKIMVHNNKAIEYVKKEFIKICVKRQNCT